MSPRNFSYTSHRGAYLSIVTPFIGLFVIEGSFVALFIAVLVHLLWFRDLLLGSLLLLYCVVFFRLMAPFWTKHRLSGTHVHLRYGLTFSMSIPLTSIGKIQCIRERLTVMQPINVSYNARLQRLVVCFSEQGQLLLELSSVQSVKVGKKTCMVRTILLNVDQPEAFLASFSATSKVLIAQPEPGLSTELRHLPEKNFAASTRQILSTQKPAIRIVGLSRRFADVTAVHDLHMQIAVGEIYGFLGSNGAGKTTTIKMLVGLLEPDAGQVWLAGHDVWTNPVAAKAVLGYVPDRSLLYERLTGREFLNFMAQMRGLPCLIANERVTNLLALLELTEHADRLCGAYSFGMKRKLSLAAALLHQPPVLILDEPLNGLDPRSARRIKDLLLEQAARGTTILFSTHDLITAETLCQRVGIFHKGSLLAEGSAAELRQLVSAPDLETVFLNLTNEQEVMVSL